MNKSFYLIALILVVFFSSEIFAVDKTVTKTADTNDGVCDADCSLREAIITSTAGDTVVFSGLFSSAQTITLTLGEINILADLTINGTGAGLLTISGNNLSRVFIVPAGVIVSFNDLTIADGNTSDLLGGGAVNSRGTVTISNSIITNNIAIEAGGGIFSRGTLTVNNSTIRNNTASDMGLGSSGGGIFTRGTATITNSTISNNQATDIGGGSEAGGIFSRDMITVHNSTISGNSATSGGGIFVRDTGDLVNVTITNNSATDGGGIYDNGGSVINCRNAIIAGNTATVSSPDFFGVATSQGSNLIGNTSGSSGWIISDKLDMSPVLGVLANNGGRTLTHALLAGSPAIDAGDNCVVSSCISPPFTTDQRGFPRQFEGGTFSLLLNVDIGAFEYRLGPTAAAVTISGRVFSPDGRGVPHALVLLTNPHGETKTARTSSFGYYRIDGIPAGETQVVSVLSKSFQFASVVISANEDLFDLNFVGISDSKGH